MPLATNYPDLNALFGQQSMIPGRLGMQQYQQAQQNDQQNLKDAQQNFGFNEQNNPLKIRHQDLTNQSLSSLLPGQAAESSILQDKATISRNTLPQAQDAELMKHLASGSDSDIKMMHNQAESMSMYGTPQEQAAGQNILRHTKDIIAEREKQKYMSDRQMELARLQGQNQMAVANVNAGARQAAAKVRDPATAAMLEGNPVKRLNLYNGLVTQAENDGDTELANYYKKQANAAMQSAQNAQNNAGAMTYTPGPNGLIATPRASNVPMTPYNVTNTPTQQQNRAPVGATTQAPQPTAAPKTPEEYKALPSGTLYTDTDGSVKRKK